MTPEELLWLRQNWAPGDTTFRQWVAGSDRAHLLVLDLLDDYEAVKAAGILMAKALEAERLARRHPWTCETCNAEDYCRTLGELVIAAGNLRNRALAAWKALWPKEAQAD